MKKSQEVDILWVIKPIEDVLDINGAAKTMTMK